MSNATLINDSVQQTVVMTSTDGASADPEISTSGNIFHVSFLRVLKSEWIKFRSLPSTWWALGITFVGSVGFALIMSWGLRMMYQMSLADPDMTAEGESTSAIAVLSMAVAQIVLVILGVLTVTNEYASGMIRSTLTAVPKRWPVLGAKTVLSGVVTFVFSFVVSYIVEFLSWPIVSSFAVDDRLSVYGVRVVAGLSLANMLIVIMALAVGALLRNTAGAVGTVLGILLVLPGILSFINWTWVQTIGAYLPSTASSWLFTFGTGAANAMSWPVALLTMCCWAFIPMVVAGVLLKKRDA